MVKCTNCGEEGARFVNSVDYPDKGTLVESYYCHKCNRAFKITSKLKELKPVRGPMKLEKGAGNTIWKKLGLVRKEPQPRVGRLDQEELEGMRSKGLEKLNDLFDFPERKTTPRPPKWPVSEEDEKYKKELKRLEGIGRRYKSPEEPRDVPRPPRIAKTREQKIEDEQRELEEIGGREIERETEELERKKILKEERDRLEEEGKKPPFWKKGKLRRGLRKNVGKPIREYSDERRDLERKRKGEVISREHEKNKEKLESGDMSEAKYLKKTKRLIKRAEKPIGSVASSVIGGVYDKASGFFKDAGELTSKGVGYYFGRKIRAEIFTVIILILIAVVVMSFGFIWAGVAIVTYGFYLIMPDETRIMENARKRTWAIQEAAIRRAEKLIEKGDTGGGAVMELRKANYTDPEAMVELLQKNILIKKDDEARRIRRTKNYN